MNTNEEKLLKLLQLLKIATENGYTLHESVNLHFIIYVIENNKCRIKTGLKNLTIVCNGQYDYSFNDLVTNWKPNEVSFIEALCKADDSISEYANDNEFYSTYLDLHINIIRDWSSKPTSKRLDWLFETFKHLLTPNQ